MPISKTHSIVSNDSIAGSARQHYGDEHSNAIRHGKMGQAERAFSAASTFLSGIMAISASQFIGAPLKLVDINFYHAYMAWTKESFAVLVSTITQFWSPTVVRVSGDESMKDQIYKMNDGSLKCNFPHRLVLMANHQLYTDWLYLWWTAYTNNMHGHIYIILKESLKQLPIFGWGAQFYNFIFLSRKWETDKDRFKSALSRLKNAQRPMWLLIFPEGTNLSESTREKSAAWAQKSGITDMKHQLLPRTTGLQFCLQELRQTTNWLYDCTIAYEDIPPGQYGQDIFTLRSTFLEGRPPKSVNMFWRRFRISEIPIDNNEAFVRWLTNRWREKDYILEYFYRYKRFPAEDAMKAIAAVRGERKAKHAARICTEVRAGGWDELLSIFGPITSAAGALSSIDLTEPLDLDALLGKVAMRQHFNLFKSAEGKISDVSQQMVRNALQAAQKSQALPKSVLSHLLKETPETQEQMRRAIVTSAQKSENLDMARRAEKVAAIKRTLPSHGIQMKGTKAIGQVQTQKTNAIVSSSSNGKMPLLGTKQTTRTVVKPTESGDAGAENSRFDSKAPSAAMVKTRRPSAKKSANSANRSYLAEKEVALSGL